MPNDDRDDRALRDIRHIRNDIAAIKAWMRYGGLVALGILCVLIYMALVRG